MIHRDAVMLMAYGAPSSLDEVAEVFTHIRGGRRPPDERIEELKERYRAIGGGESLLRVTEAQAVALEAHLAGDGGGKVTVTFGMRHARPFIRGRIKDLAAGGVRRVVGLPLAPHFSSLSIGAYHAAIREAASALDDPPELLLVDSYHDHPGLIGAFAETLGSTLATARAQTRDPVRVIFTAHSLPERIIAEGEPYRDQLLATARLVAREAGAEEWDLAFQSASPTGEPWLGPDFLDVVRDLTRAGRRSIVIAPIGFVSDHLEILYDVDVLCRRVAEAEAVRMWRTPSLNDRPAFIAALAAIARGKLSEPPTTSGPKAG